MTRAARGAESVGVWALSLLLAAVFLITGISKILGTGTIGLEAAAMASFPQWIRIVVGVVEVLGAIGLLIPTLAPVAAVVLALLMIPATITQTFVAGGNGWVPVSVFVLLLIIGWRRDADNVRAGYIALRDTPHPILHEGAIAGIIGATVVAVWFLGVDLVAGDAFRTPERLGRAFLSVLGPAPDGESEVMAVFAYTIFHYAAFIAVGSFASLVINIAGREPSVLIAFAMLFVAFEVGFYAFVALLEQASDLRVFAWYQVAAGNLLAAMSMGWYLWHAHGELASEYEHALDYDTDEHPVTGAHPASYSASSGTPPVVPGSSS